MLVMSTRLAVGCTYSPVVALCNHFGSSHVYHRFHGNYHTVCKQRTRVTFTVIGYFWGFVEVSTNAVPYKLPYYSVSPALAIALNAVANVAGAVTAFGGCQALEQGSVGVFKQLPYGGLNFSYRESVGTVGVKTVELYTAINGNNITFFQNISSGKSVYYLLVYRYTGGSRKYMLADPIT